MHNQFSSEASGLYECFDHWLLLLWNHEAGSSEDSVELKRSVFETHHRLVSAILLFDMTYYEAATCVWEAKILLQVCFFKNIKKQIKL